MERRRIKGVEIPKSIWYNDKLSIVEKCVLAEIKNTQEEFNVYAVDSNNCVVDSKFCAVKGSKISNIYIANFAGCSVRSVSSILAKLQEFNYIIIKNGNTAQRIIIYNAKEIEQTTTQNLRGSTVQSKENKKSNKKTKEIVSKKVKEKNILYLEGASAYTCESFNRLESYEDILNGLEVHGIYRLSVFDFIKHLQANGCKVINSRLESLVMAIDRAYRSNDVAKCVEIKTAIANGYKRLPCEGYN
jgi:hypothetical protein